MSIKPKKNFIMCTVVCMIFVLLSTVIIQPIQTAQAMEALELESTYFDLDEMYVFSTM